MLEGDLDELIDGLRDREQSQKLAETVPVIEVAADSTVARARWGARPPRSRRPGSGPRAPRPSGCSPGSWASSRFALYLEPARRLTEARGGPLPRS